MRDYRSNRINRYSDAPANLDSERCRKKIDQIIDDPNGYKISDEYNHSDVRKKLITHFGVKCVYCESSPIATSTFRIDHFRPKKGIKEDKLHTGYYWLGYEWSNLLQSCQLCNGSKLNHFPLISPSSRVTETTPSALDAARRKPDTVPLSNEQRLLLHPELDDVESHFYFNAIGEIFSDSAEGKKSIKIYDLNRQYLIGERKKINDELIRRTKRELYHYEQGMISNAISAKTTLFSFLRNEFGDLLNDYINSGEYSLFRSNIFEKYEDFVVSEISSPGHKDILSEAYSLFKEGRLNS